MIYIKKRGLLSNSDVQDVMGCWSVNGDPLHDFISTIFFDDSKSSVTHHYSKPKLHKLYLKWCVSNNLPEHKIKRSMKSFTTSLQSHHFIPTKVQYKGDRYEVYASTMWGVTFVPDKPTDLDYKTSNSTIDACIDAT